MEAAQRRKVRRELPLFPGYVFTKLFPDERLKMLETNLIVHPIPVPRPREMIHQLRQIAHASKGRPEMRPAQMFTEGEYVRVKFGPLMGTEGYVKREGAQTTLVLNVEIRGSSVEVSVLPDNLERIDPATA